MSETVAAQIERGLSDEWYGPGTGSFAVYDHPNPPTAEEYADYAEKLGYRTQRITDSSGSTGAYYEVWAVYPGGDDKFFGTEPLALIFEDFSRSVCLAWVIGDEPIPESATPELRSASEGA